MVAAQKLDTAEAARNRARSARKRGVRLRTLGNQELRRLVRVDAAAMPAGVERPKTRGDCERGPRPCPWVGCRHHLYLDVRRTGSLLLHFPDVAPDELPETCSLDVAARGANPLEQVGELLNFTREAVRLAENQALESFVDNAPPQLLRELLEFLGSSP